MNKMVRKSDFTKMLFLAKDCVYYGHNTSKRMNQVASFQSLTLLFLKNAMYDYLLSFFEGNMTKHVLLKKFIELVYAKCVQ